MNQECGLCGAPITGMFVGLGGNAGVAHRHCFEREHPPREATTIYQVGRGAADPVLAAEVIAELTPPDVAAAIVGEFNRRVRELHARRCMP